MSMPTEEEQKEQFKQQIKYSLLDILKDYKEDKWNDVNDLTFMFPATPYDSVLGYIDPDIEIPKKLDKIIRKIAYLTQNSYFIKKNITVLTNSLFPKLIKTAKAEKLLVKQKEVNHYES